MPKMTQSKMLDVLAKETGLSKKDVKSVMDAMTDLALKEVKKSGEFTIKGVGKLVKKRRKARMGRNPMTGAKIKIPAKTVVKFRVAKAAKDAVL
jgi:DNA-binding protein HU-beta